VNNPNIRIGSDKLQIFEDQAVFALMAEGVRVNMRLFVLH
jgi:hypothetical protein